MAVSGGLRSVGAVAGRPTVGGDAQFLLDLIRVSYGSEPSDDARARPATPARELVAHQEEPDVLPLALPERVWIDIVFGGRATTQTLLADILGSRNTALFYYGVLSLDDETRAWLAEEPHLVRDLVARYPGSFSVAARGLRVAGGRIRPPGGERAVPAWEALVGRSSSRPGEFTRALVAEGEGRLAYFFAAMAPLSARQLELGLNLAADQDKRVAAARRLYRAFEQIAGAWQVERSPFRRPTLDPGMLLTDLSVDLRGEPVLPGTAAFWGAALDQPQGRVTGPNDENVGRLAQGARVEFSWLCEQMTRGGAHHYRRGHLMVLFASRVVGQVTSETVRDAIDAIRAADAYPALTTTLERAGVDDVGIIARAARRAAQLSNIGDDARAARSLAQFQGLVFVLARAALRGVLPAGAVNDAVASLVNVEPSRDGDYQGRLVDWLSAFLDARRSHDAWRLSAAGAAGAAAPAGLGASEDASLEARLLRVLSGETDVDRPIVEWEGNRYRVDFASAEAARIAALLGEGPSPYLSAAKATVEIAEWLSLPGRRPDSLRAQTAILEGLLEAADWDSDARGWLERVVAKLSQPDSRLAENLRLLADDLLARGLTQYAYAVAMGQPSRATVSAGEVARRHDFGLSDTQRRKAWQLSIEGTDPLRGWHLHGSILGIDVTLAGRALTRVSTRPPPRAPTVDSRIRQVLTEAVALVEPSTLSNADMSAIAASLGRGRERLTRVRTREEAAAVADEIRLDPERRTLLVWTAMRHPEWLESFLAPLELFWLGLEGRPVGPSLQAWGAPVGARIGCLCLRLDPPLPLGMLAGRWDAALLASGFADLSLRLAELLSQLEMPASVLAPVLAAATFDLVQTAHQRDSDDRRGLEAFVGTLEVEHVEEYLALLTTGGPLVPMEQSVAAHHRVSHPRALR